MGFGMGAAISGGLGLGSTVVSGLFNRHEANKNRNWQEDMSNTSIRRRVADLKAAGLNPLLAVSSASAGASTPSGSTATIDTSGINTGISNAIQAYNQSRLIDADVALKESERNLNYDKMITNEIDRLNTQMDTELKRVGIDSEKFKQSLLSAQTEKERKAILSEIARKNNIDADTQYRLANTATVLYDLEVKRRDIGNTEQGLKDRHYKNTAPSNAYEAVYEAGRHAVDYASDGKSAMNKNKKSQSFKSSVPSNAERIIKEGYISR